MLPAARRGPADDAGALATAAPVRATGRSKGLKVHVGGADRVEGSAPVAPGTRPDPRGRRRTLFNAVVVVVFGLLLLGLAWPFISDTSRLAVTKDPAWYTWRGKLILEANPALLLT